MVHCSICGHDSAAGEKFCGRCGNPIGSSSSESTSSPQVAPQHGGGPPDNHLAKAIVSTIVCCLPAGVVAIVYAASVNGKFISGDVSGAHQAANNANTWGNWSIGLGLVGGVIYALFMLFAGLSEY